jgi:altronate hydrolase
LFKYSEKKSFIQIHPADNVAVALTELSAGSVINLKVNQFITLQQDIPKGHKFAVSAIHKLEHVIKYGSVIGHAFESIQAGGWIHSHNLKTCLDHQLDYEYQPELLGFQLNIPPDEVNIYRRSNGQVGIRNELWVIPTVGCVNGIARQIVDTFLAQESTDGIDGVYYFPHQFGCSQLGDDHQTTKTLLQQMAKHPNAGGVLVIGLGCENNQVSSVESELREYDAERIRFMVSQQVGNEVEEGVCLLKEIYQVAHLDRREYGTLAEINFGLECGGSDSLSGITANPLIGQFSDWAVAQGGTTVLTEVPEMFGAEYLLMQRCPNKETFVELVELINSFKCYYQQYNQPVYENPSPGNKMGGITTLEEKSLGCTQKSGSQNISSILDYGEPISATGLTLLNAPGNDAIATSALGASGCHLVLFSTGRGTPYGGFVPTVKISSNTAIGVKKGHWIDFDAGSLVEGEDMDFTLEQFKKLIVAIINGQPTRNELNNMREIAIWKKGVTL